MPDFRQDSWPLMRALLANPDLRAGPQDIQFALAHFKEMLEIRKSSPLFRLQNAQEIQQRLSFLNTGMEQLPGLIVMVLDDTQGADLDPAAQSIVVAFNARPEAASFTDPALQGMSLALHPVQQNSADVRLASAVVDSATGTLTVPGRTTAVFVLRQEQAPAQFTAVPDEAEQAPSGKPISPANSLLTLAGIVGLVMALGAGIFAFLRRKK